MKYYRMWPNVINGHKCFDESIFLISGGLSILLALLQRIDTLTVAFLKNKDEMYEINAPVFSCSIKSLYNN